MNTQVIRDVVFLAGFSMIGTAAFLVAIPLGLLVVGGPLVAWSLYASRTTLKGDKK